MTHDDTAEVARLRAELDRRRREYEETLKAYDEHRSALLSLLDDVEEGRRQLEQARNDWSTAFDAVADPIFLHDKDFRVIRANRAYVEHAGVEPGTVAGKPYWQLFPRRGGPLPSCARAIETKRMEEVELTLPDGRIYRSRSYPILDAQGAYQYSLHLLHDITAQRHAEEALRVSRNLLQSVVENAPIRIFWKDTDSRYLGGNSAFARDAGLTRPEELIGKDDFQIGWRKQAELYRADDRRVMESDTPKLGFEEPQTTPDGRTIWLRTSKVPLHDDTGKVIGVLGIYEDITERKQTETRLQDSERKYRELVQDANSIILHWTRDGHVLFINEFGERFFGYTDEELRGRHVVGTIVPEVESSGRNLKQLMKKITADPKQYEINTNENMRRSGERVWVQWTNRFILDEHGQPAEILSVGTDVTNLRRAEVEMRRLNWALQALSQSNSALVHAETEQALYQACCEGITTADGYDLAWVGIAENNPEKTVRVAAAAGRARAYMDGIRITWADEPLGRGPTGTVIRAGSTQVNNDFQANPAFAPWLARAQAHGLSSSIALPIRSDGKVIGALTVYGREPQSFNAPEIKLFEELADDIGYGLASRHARRERDAALTAHQHSLEQLRESLEATIAAIAATLEMRDPYTAGHERRVAELATAIAREMGLPQDRIEGIHFGSLIHDLGKIKVPAEILSKPTVLTKSEFDLVKEHAQSGYDILKGIKFPWPVAKMAQQHHERVDGSGYPDGIKGEAFLLESRILAVADVVEAMSSHRPYRPALGVEAALAEINAHRGTWYDPDAVDACMRLFKEKGFTLNG